MKGIMIGGFALVATPAEYRVTGVKTFIVSNDGVVYEKDFGIASLDARRFGERAVFGNKAGTATVLASVADVQARQGRFDVRCL